MYCHSIAGNKTQGRRIVEARKYTFYQYHFDFEKRKK